MAKTEHQHPVRTRCLNIQLAAVFQLVWRAGVGQSGVMSGRIAALCRHPVKGFTPERLDEARLEAGRFFPCDRIYAVEDGPSGFDPRAPVFIPKTRFAVLAKIAEVAKARTAYDESSGVLHAEADGLDPFKGNLETAQGRAAFAGWLGELLGEAASSALKVVHAEGHRFTDHPTGYVSVINLESLRELESRIGQPIDPLRFRANLYVEGWPAWSELSAEGREVRLGSARAQVMKSIVRCAATQVNPSTAERDIDVPAALFEAYGHVLCGVYVEVVGSGDVREGSAAIL